MQRRMPCTQVRTVSARLPRGWIQPLRIIIFTGFLLSAMFVLTAEEISLTAILLVTLQVVFSFGVLIECGRSAAFYKTMDQAAAAARKREKEGYY